MDFLKSITNKLEKFVPQDIQHGQRSLGVHLALDNISFAVKSKQKKTIMKNWIIALLLEKEVFADPSLESNPCVITTM